MGLLDKAKKLAKDNADKIEKGIDKAASVAEKRTSGKQRSRVRQVADKAKDAVENLADDKKEGPPDTPPSRREP